MVTWDQKEQVQRRADRQNPSDEEKYKIDEGAGCRIPVLPQYLQSCADPLAEYHCRREGRLRIQERRGRITYRDGICVIGK